MYSLLDSARQFQIIWNFVNFQAIWQLKLATIILGIYIYIYTDSSACVANLQFVLFKVFIFSDIYRKQFRYIANDVLFGRLGNMCSFAVSARQFWIWNFIFKPFDNENI